MKNIIVSLAIAVLFLILSFIGGCVYHKKVFSSPVAKSDTILVHDTVTHYIPSWYPWYIAGKDTIIHDTIPRIVDTLAILQDYYDKHVFDRKWENDTLLLNLRDTISRNIPLNSSFRYRIKIPFTTINNSVDNSVTYQSYLYAGLEIPTNNINNINLQALLAMPKMYAGVSYQPNIKVFSVNFGVKIFQFIKK